MKKLLAALALFLSTTVGAALADHTAHMAPLGTQGKVTVFQDVCKDPKVLSMHKQIVDQLKQIKSPIKRAVVIWEGRTISACWGAFQDARTGSTYILIFDSEGDAGAVPESMFVQVLSI